MEIEGERKRTLISFSPEATWIVKQNYATGRKLNYVNAPPL